MSDVIYHIPYTYLIKFKPTGQVYYGVRYAKGCSPNDLWKTYFTSSKVVKSLIEEHGKDAFECEIRKTFDTADAAREWEARVLKRMNAKNNSNFLNRQNNDGNFYGVGNTFKGKNHSEETKKLISEKKRGFRHTDKTKEKIGNYWKGRKRTKQNCENISKGTQGRTISEEQRKSISETLKGHQNNTDEVRKKISQSLKGIDRGEEWKNKMKEIHKNKTYITNGYVIKQHNKNEPIPDGWVHGRKLISQNS